MSVTTRTRARRAVLAGVAFGSTLALSACAFPSLPGGGDSAKPVGFDGVQSATIQLEAVGRFVDPYYGGYEAAGRGSGFIISPDGLAVTNNHVVVGAGTLEVWRGGDQSKTLNAQVLGASECLDIAVVQLPQGTYPYLDWYEGEIGPAVEVYAAGFPLGDPNFTLTRGIVSKISAGETGWASVDSVIEHDARIRNGNSGGPLVDSEGRVVGVNYAGEDHYDYNFAIHRDEVLRILDRLIEGEDVLSLGVNAKAVVDSAGTGLGIWVSSVAAGSPADKAGVEPGDLLTRLAGVTLGRDGTLADYCDVLRTQGQGATMDIELYRPADGLYYRGQVNAEGRAVEPVTVLGGGGSTGQFVTVTDDYGVISVEVPDSWSDIDGAPFQDDGGNTWAAVDASSNLNSYRSSWSTPGVSIMASADAVGTYTPDALMEIYTSSLTDSGCRLDDADEYDDGYHVGQYSYWTGCGPEKASYVIVTAESTERDYVILVAVQANTDSDLDAIDRVLGSFIAEF